MHHVSYELFSVKMVSNIVVKEENARCQHFLLFPQCLQKLNFPKPRKSKVLYIQQFRIYVNAFFSSSASETIFLDGSKFCIDRVEILRYKH